MLGLKFILVGLLLAAVSGVPQFYFFPVGYQPFYQQYPSQYPSQVESSYQPSDYFRQDLLPYQPQSPELQLQPDSVPDTRLFFNALNSGGTGGVTITYSTTTVTSTSVVTTFCSTSTAALITCTAGRRRRSPSSQSLFYNEEDNQDVFLKSAVEEQPTIENDSNQAAGGDDTSMLIQSTLTERSKRSLVSFVVGTSTATVTSTFISSLTAVCSSTTGFRVCTASG